MECATSVNGLSKPHFGSGTVCIFHMLVNEYNNSLYLTTKLETR
jgi:hypothetical protein